jgi:hypothetical protein
MRIQCDSLKYARILEEKGIKAADADGIMSTITAIEIFNIYSRHEVDNMISESIEKVFIKQSESIEKLFSKQDEKLAKQDLKLAEQRREFDAQMKDVSKYHEAKLQDSSKYHDSQLKEQRSELKEYRSELLASRRWTIGTIITVGLSLAAYLSALIRYNH